MLNANLSDNILYLGTFTFKSAKHKMATKIIRKLIFFYSVSHIKAQFMVSARFVIDNNSYGVFGKKLPLNPRYPHLFMYLLLLYEYC